jgi:hypothetical protein
MPLSPKSKIVAIRTQLTQKLVSKHYAALKEKPSQTNPDFGGYVNDLLQTILDKDEFLRRYAPTLETIDIHNNVLILRDLQERGNLIQVSIREDRLWCNYCESKNCKHVTYCFAIPEIAKFNLTDPENGGTKNITTSIKKVYPMDPPKSISTNEKIKSVTRILDIMKKHSDESDCKHTFIQIMKEWYPESEKYSDTL